MNKKKVVLGSGILVVLIAVMVLIWTNFREKPAETPKGGEQGSVVETMKEVTIEVVNSEEESVIYELETDADYLRQAMEGAKEKGLEFDGDESDYGMMVDSINGERAVYSEGAYWYFYVNGEACNYGIDTQPVEDGDAFKIVYTKVE